MHDHDGEWEPITRTDAAWIFALMIAGLAPWVGLGIYIGWWIWA